jgi:hypothetical protein
VAFRRGPSRDLSRLRRRGPLDRDPGAVQGVVSRCTYDNSLDDPFVKWALLEAKLFAPKDVPFGESIFDEMGLGSSNLLPKK